MEPFKNLYNKKSIGQMALEIKKNNPNFDEELFLKRSTKNLSSLEMKERVVQIAESLHEGLSGNYRKDIKTLLKTLKKNEKDQEGLSGFILWPYSCYIETYGGDYFDLSMKALYELTKRFTSEFGIRPFFEKEPEKVYGIFTDWAQDKNEHIRRWVSEGTRPNLPWGQKISHLEKNLKRNIKLLEILKNDSSEYVRKSVANHMNDISWYDSELVIKTMKKWQNIKTKEMEWQIKRALRTLLKQGNPDALILLGYDHKNSSEIEKLKLSKNKIKEGDSFEVSFILQNKEKKNCSYMADYIIYYPKANGQLSPKTFKLKTLSLEAQGSAKIRKKVSFKKVTTRKHYKGKHILQIQINGVIKKETSFVLL